ncbi:HAD superfamily hydrolase (TIGR01509 family) [Pasteurella langaaensis DSM 22999]|uniref:HAD superfamily hydrolase (TIGR01509 family) n=1 Tax=Alitibacter langaaensis DSM 22999 TaxID=1122935 RepID=A0A2U0T5A9_9PAST|nr:HAD-IA family hydrolase [Pasteurella langaaensis]PVX38783.1 HAD superfamily hydrolase (TIGR01509 family) [Pasteurella langaaensis DSM 22999]
MTIKNVIFDMDGVLIDSEPFWAEAQISILARYGINITDDDCEKYTRGVRVDELAVIWIDMFHLDITPAALKEEIIQTVCLRITAEGKPMAGLYELLDFLKSKQIQLALATSSNRQVIQAVFDKLKLWDYFPIQCTAADEELAKPHPAVYLSAVKKLAASVRECVIIEDSVTGLIAAKAANIRTFIVNPNHNNDRFAIADKRVATLNDVLAILKSEL